MWDGFEQIGVFLKEDHMVRKKLDTVVQSLSDMSFHDRVNRDRPNGMEEAFYKSTWPMPLKPLYSFIANHTILETIIASGFRPDFITGEKPSGILLALALSGMMDLEHALHVLGGYQDPEEINLLRPRAFPFYDPLTRQMILTYHIDATYLSTLINDIMITEEETRHLIEKARIMLANQYTFKKSIEQWGLHLKKSANIDLRRLLYDNEVLFNPDGSYRKTRLLIMLIIEVTFHQINRKWDLSGERKVSDRNFHELLDLVLDNVITPELLFDLLTEKEPDLCAMASKLNQRQVYLDKEKPYILLERHSSSIKPFEQEAWFNKAANVPLPAFDKTGCLILGIQPGRKKRIRSE